MDISILFLSTNLYFYFKFSLFNLLLLCLVEKNKGEIDSSYKLYYAI